MILRFNFQNIYFFAKIIVFTVYSIVCTIANDVQKCTIGVLDDCPPSYSCIQTDFNHEIGRCECRDGCPPNDSTVKPLPIYSDGNNSNNSSVIISSIFGSMSVLLIVFSAYYFGVRKGLFRDIWGRAFTPRQVEHQLLDRSPSIDDNNDSEAIA